MNKKKTIILGITFLTVIMISGASFALWQITLKQSTTNVITTGCFKIEFQEENPISLENAFPITDEEGSKFVPYTFTIRNTCESYASYQINLEILNSTTFENLDHLKIMFEDNIDLLSKKETVSKTLDNAITSKKLETGYLDTNESKTYHLRLWMSEDTPNDEMFMNKVFQSKVTVIATHQTEFDRESPSSAIEVTNLSNKIKVDASKSSDNTNIKYYYYSLDGENFVKTTEPEYTFEVGALEYGVATETIKALADSLNEEYTVYVKAEDEYGNVSEVVSQKVYQDFAYDETTDSNLRYIGSNPNNYVSFNNELWRIIGVMNNIDDGTGKKESRIKLIRNESIGNYSWDISEQNVNSGDGVNEWSQADAMKLLNPGYELEEIDGSLYWNSKSGTCYNGQNSAKTDCDFSKIGLSEEAKLYIENAVWYLGANNSFIDDYDALTSSKFYEYERGNQVGKICSSGPYCSDSVTRNLTWTGKIGLMYPSDYGYATSGEDARSRKMCLDTFLYNWNMDTYQNCITNNWLYSETYQWTITPSLSATYTGNAHMAFFILDSGNVWGWSGVFNNYDMYPTFFLKSSIKVIDGIGTIEEPYRLSL